MAILSSCYLLEIYDKRRLFLVLYALKGTTRIIWIYLEHIIILLFIIEFIWTWLTLAHFDDNQMIWTIHDAVIMLLFISFPHLLLIFNRRYHWWLLHDLILLLCNFLTIWRVIAKVLIHHLLIINPVFLEFMFFICLNQVKRGE